MINCMLVKVRDLLYLTLHIISCIHQNKSSPYPTYYMFLILKYILFVQQFCHESMSFFSFTLLFSKSRISSPRKSFFLDGVKTASMSSPSLLPHLCRKHFRLLAWPLLQLFGIVAPITPVPVL